jgi:hypothetical protein
LEAKLFTPSTNGEGLLKSYLRLHHTRESSKVKGKATTTKSKED